MFKKKTVSSIIAGFNKMADDLDAVAAEASLRSEKISTEIAQLGVEHDELVEEAGRALSVRANIMKIVEG